MQENSDIFNSASSSKYGLENEQNNMRTNYILFIIASFFLFFTCTPNTSKTTVPDTDSINTDLKARVQDTKEADHYSNVLLENEEDSINYDLKVMTQKIDEMYHHFIVLLENEKDTICINHDILPSTLPEYLYTNIEKHKDYFSLSVEYGGAHPEGCDYFVFKRESNTSHDFTIDSIKFMSRDYDLSEEDYMFFIRTQTFTKPQLKNINFCNFKIYENDKLADLGYLGIKDRSMDELDRIFYNYCNKPKDKIAEISSLDYIQKMMEIAPLSKNTLECYNNIAFSLEEKSQYKEAIFILAEIINQYPNRVATYLDIANVYWMNNEQTNAKQNYQKYIDLLKSQNKNTTKIPQQIYDRLK